MRHEPVVAVEAICGCGHGLFRGGEERVDPDPQPISSRPPRRVAEPLGREERRRSERVGRCEREVREARKAGLEAVDDVEVALGGARARGLREPPPGLRCASAARSGSTARSRSRLGRCPRCRARRPARRSRAREDGASTVTSWPSRRRALRHAVDVGIHLVRLRPREGRDEADAEAHRRLTVAHPGNGTTCTFLEWRTSRSRHGRTARTRSRGLSGSSTRTETSSSSQRGAPSRSAAAGTRGRSRSATSPTGASASSRTTLRRASPISSAAATQDKPLAAQWRLDAHAFEGPARRDQLHSVERAEHTNRTRPGAQPK